MPIFSGRFSKFLLEHWDDFALDYDLPVAYDGDSVQLTASSGRCAVHKGTLLRPGVKLRIWFACKIDFSKGLPYAVALRLFRFVDTRRVARERALRRQVSGKTFIK